MKKYIDAAGVATFKPFVALRCVQGEPSLNEVVITGSLPRPKRWNGWPLWTAGEESLRKVCKKSAANIARIKRYLELQAQQATLEKKLDAVFKQIVMLTPP